MRQFAFVDINRTNLQAHGFGILNGQMPQAADARDDHPLTRPRLGFFQAFVRRDARTDERRCSARRQAHRNVGHVVRVCHDVVGKTAVFGITAELRLGAHRLPCRQTIFTMPAGRIQPGHPDPVAFFDGSYACTQRRDDADAFMPRRKRQAGLYRPVSLGGMQVGVANTAGLGPDQNLTRTRRGYADFPDHERLAEFLHKSSLHGALHDFPFR